MTGLDLEPPPGPSMWAVTQRKATHDTDARIGANVRRCFRILSERRAAGGHPHRCGAGRRPAGDLDRRGRGTARGLYFFRSELPGLPAPLPQPADADRTTRSANTLD